MEPRATTSCRGRFWDILKAVLKWGESKDDARERGRIEQLRARLDAAVEDLVRLVAIFVVQTVLLPLLFVGLLGRLLSVLVVASRALDATCPRR